MAKVNKVIVDEKGNLQVEFSCYDGNECRVEEERFRRELAELGLAVKVDSFKPKSPQQIEAERKTQQQRPVRRKVET